MFIKPLVVTACLAFLTLCGVSITSMIGFDADQPSGWGEILTLISILAAGFIAACTLFYANHQAKKERERVAYAGAKTLFREFELITIPAQIALAKYFEAEEERDQYIKAQPSAAQIPSRSSRREFFSEVMKHVEEVNQILPKFVTNFREASPLYQHQSELGDKATNVIISLQRLDYIIPKFISDSDAGMALDYECGKDKELIAAKIYTIMRTLSAVLRDLEKFRVILKATEYRQNKNKQLLENLATLAIRDADAPNKPVQNYDYIELFSALYKHFET